jgi:hypothetical protein
MGGTECARRYICTFVHCTFRQADVKEYDVTEQNIKLALYVHCTMYSCSLELHYLLKSENLKTFKLVIGKITS